MLYNWFQEWFESYKHTKLPRLEDRQLHFRQILWPCWQYDHAVGFLEATKFVVYHSRGHITEHKPTKHYERRLPSAVIQQLNAAKGRQRTRLHAMLFKPIEGLLHAKCKCKEKTLFQYVKALPNTKVWPLEPIWPKMGVGSILEHLVAFSYQPPESACHACRERDYERDVCQAIGIVLKYFDGLCLDCMDKSKAKTADYDSDYWSHNSLDEDGWDRGCRVRHGEPTWYFSFMGRKEDQERFFKTKNIPLHAP